MSMATLGSQALTDDQTLILIESSRILRKNINFMTNMMRYYVSFASKIQYEHKNRGGSKKSDGIFELKKYTPR